METIFSKPMDIQTFDGHNLIGVTKTVVNLEFDTITFYMGKERILSQKNNSYTMTSYSLGCTFTNKKTMKNQCIKVLNEEHGKKVIEYFKNLGVDTGELTGESVEDYYGLFGGEFSFYGTSRNSEVIELPTKESEFKRGDKVVVWYNDEDFTSDCIFLAEIKNACYPYIVVTKEELEKECFTFNYYKNCKHAPQTVELTLQDISDGKGVGFDPKLIKII